MPPRQHDTKFQAEGCNARESRLTWDVLHAANALQHAQHSLVCASVQGAIQGTHGARHSCVHIHATAGQRQQKRRSSVADGMYCYEATTSKHGITVTVAAAITVTVTVTVTQTSPRGQVPASCSGAVHLVLLVQDEHDLQGTRQPGVWPAAQQQQPGSAHTLVWVGYHNITDVQCMGRVQFHVRRRAASQGPCRAAWCTLTCTLRIALHRVVTAAASV